MHAGEEAGHAARACLGETPCALPHLCPVQRPLGHVARQHRVPLLEHLLHAGALQQGSHLHDVLVPAASVHRG